MVELLKKSFEFFVRKRRLKIIDKECDKYIKIKIKLSRQQCIVNSLLAEYTKIYGEDLRVLKESGERNGGKHDFSKMFLGAEIKPISNLQDELLPCPFCGEIPKHI